MYWSRRIFFPYVLLRLPPSLSLSLSLTSAIVLPSLICTCLGVLSDRPYGNPQFCSVKYPTLGSSGDKGNDLKKKRKKMRPRWRDRERKFTQIELRYSPQSSFAHTVTLLGTDYTPPNHSSLGDRVDTSHPTRGQDRAQAQDGKNEGEIVQMRCDKRKIFACLSKKLFDIKILRV